MSSVPDHTRRALLGAGAGATLAATAASAQPVQGRSPSGRAAGPPGLRPGSDEDQTAALQRALSAASRDGSPVYLPAGRYRVGGLVLPSGGRLVGAGVGATVLVQAGAEPALVARGGEQIAISGVTLAGNPAAAPTGALASFADVAGLVVAETALTQTRGTALRLERCSGRIERCAITQAGVAIFSLDAAGLQIVANTIDGCRNNGIQVWRSQKGYDGTQVLANRVSNVRAEAGGSGQNGNGINVFRAGGVIVGENVIRDCAFTAVRNNAGDNVQILGNSCMNLGEVGIYAEFSFEGCVIANNLVDRASTGISITNFNENGRLAVASGNILRNLFRRPDPGTGALHGGVGIAVEADASVTGNVIESAEKTGIAIGYGTYQRDVVCSSNVARRCAYGVSVSVVANSGTAQIANNMLSECRRGRIVGFDHDNPVTGDLAEKGDPRFPQVAVHGNTGR